MFATAFTIMDLSFARGCGPSFLRLQGNASITLPLEDARYSFLWTDGPPSLNSNDYTKTWMQRSLLNGNVRR